MRLVYDGAPYDPLTEGADDLSLSLAKAGAREIACQYEDGKNHLVVRL